MGEKYEVGTIFIDGVEYHGLSEADVTLLDTELPVMHMDMLPSFTIRVKKIPKRTLLQMVLGKPPLSRWRNWLKAIRLTLTYIK